MTNAVVIDGHGKNELRAFITDFHTKMDGDPFWVSIPVCEIDLADNVLLRKRFGFVAWRYSINPKSTLRKFPYSEISITQNR